MMENNLKVDDLPSICVKHILFERDSFCTLASASLYDDLAGYEGWRYATVVSVNPREREAIIELQSDYSDFPYYYTVRCDETVIQEWQKAIAERISEMEEELSA